MLASQILPDFQQDLLSRKLVPEKSVTFYADWANRYLMFSKRLKNADAAEALRLFLEDLQPRENIADWQIQQAKVAIQLYSDHFHGGKIVGIDDDDAKTPLAPFDKDLVMVNMQKAICVKHHSLCRLARETPERGLAAAARCLASFPLLSPLRGYKTCCRRLFSILSRRREGVDTRHAAAGCLETTHRG